MRSMNKSIELRIRVRDLGSYYDYTKLLDDNNIKWVGEKSLISIHVANLSELLKVKSILQEHHIKWEEYA